MVFGPGFLTRPPVGAWRGDKNMVQNIQSSEYKIDIRNRRSTKNVYLKEGWLLTGEEPEEGAGVPVPLAPVGVCWR